MDIGEFILETEAESPITNLQHNVAALGSSVLYASSSQNYIKVRENLEILRGLLDYWSLQETLVWWLLLLGMGLNWSQPNSYTLSWPQIHQHHFLHPPIIIHVKVGKNWESWGDCWRLWKLMTGGGELLKLVPRTTMVEMAMRDRKRAWGTDVRMALGGKEFLKIGFEIVVMPSCTSLGFIEIHFCRFSFLSSMFLGDVFCTCQYVPPLPSLVYVLAYIEHNSYIYTHLILILKYYYSKLGILQVII